MLDQKIYSEKELKNISKNKKNEIMNAFKKRAIGDSIKDFEEKLQKNLEEKYSELKQNYLVQIKVKPIDIVNWIE